MVLDVMHHHEYKQVYDPFDEEVSVVDEALLAAAQHVHSLPHQNDKQDDSRSTMEYSVTWLAHLRRKLRSLRGVRAKKDQGLVDLLSR